MSKLIYKNCLVCNKRFSRYPSQFALSKRHVCSRKCIGSLFVVDPVKRFWAFVDKGESCWSWMGSKNLLGYGAFSLTPSKQVRAHRFSYELNVAKIPRGLAIDHLCRNPSCVNPGHLEVVTIGENIRRGFSKTGINTRKTHCIRGHLLKGDNILTEKLKSGRIGRHCRVCSRLRYKWKREGAWK